MTDSTASTTETTATDFADTVTLAEASLSQELKDVATQLLDLGHIVAYFPDRHRRENTWMIAATGLADTDACVTIEYDRITGYRSSFPIKPSRQLGSGVPLIKVAEDADGFLPSVHDAESVVEATQTGLVPTLALTDTALYPEMQAGYPAMLRNHGWQHFNWTAGRLVRVTN